MTWRTVALAIGSALVGALITLAVVKGGAKDADDEAKAVPRPERVSVSATSTSLAIDEATAARSGIAVTALPAERPSGDTTAFATAVDVRDLVDARNQIAVARAQETQARARLTAASAAYSRLEALHADNRNVSDRVLQEAAANVSVERANAGAAAAGARAAESGVGVRWGSAVAAAFAAGAPWIDDLVANRKVLLQVVSPSQPPRNVRVETADGSVAAEYIGPSPRTDPRLQGRSWLYVATAGMLVPGTTATVRLPAPPGATGVVVPRDAVVWADGRAFIYVNTEAHTYVKTPVDVSHEVPDGYFVATLAPGTRVVTSGAQQLLSEEAKPSVED